MGAFIARRLVGIVPVIFGVSVVIFLLVQLAPGDVVTAMLGPQATEAARNDLRQHLGLDRALPLQYLSWLRRTLSGDLGLSIATQRPVEALVVPRYVNTLILTLGSLVLAVIVGYGAGSFAALRHGSISDRVTMSATLLAGSAPPFWLGLVLVLLFAIRPRWLPVSGMRDLAGSGGALDVLRHLVLPAVTTALGPAAIITRIVRASVTEVLSQAHVRVARAKPR